MSETRRWDGAPETPADTRFFDLRESGYTGPIDQDGHAVSATWPNCSTDHHHHTREQEGP